MKCAREILEIKEKAEIQYQQEQIRLDEACRENHKKIVAQTLDFCEEISEDFVRQAAKRFSRLKYNINCVLTKDRIGNQLIQPLRFQGFLYADGEESFVPSSTTYDKKTLIDTLSKHCYKVEFQKHYYKTYGCGEQVGSKIIITLDECANC